MWKRLFAILLCACLFAPVFRISSRSAGGGEGSPLPLSAGKSYTVSLSGCSPTEGRADGGGRMTDRKFGSSRLSADDNGNWIGYTSDGGDFTVTYTLDLGRVYDCLKQFSVSTLQSTGYGVYFPAYVRYECSVDGRTYRPLGDGVCDCDLAADPYCGLFHLTLPQETAGRYIRITVGGGAEQSVFLCELLAEGRSSYTRMSEEAADGRQYTDAQGVVYTLRNGEAVVTDYRDTALNLPSGQLRPSDADFNAEGRYVLGAGSENPVTVHAEFLPEDNLNFSRLSNDIRAIVIHNTATVEDSTTAELYHSKQLRGAGDSSWHYTVDDTGTVCHSCPDEYAAWHAGSDENYASIGIELCVNGAPTNGGTDFIFTGDAFDEWVDKRFRKTIENTAVLVAELLVRYGLPESAVLQHNDCSGKNCPQWMRYSAENRDFRHDGDLWLLLTERIHDYYTRLLAGSQAFSPASDVVLPPYLLFPGAKSYPVVAVETGAFAGKGPVLRSISLPDTVVRVGDGAFADTPSLEAVTVSPTHPSFTLREGILYDENGTVLFAPQEVPAGVPAPDPEGGLWVEEVDGEYWLLGLQASCTAEELRTRYGAEDLRLYADAPGTGVYLLADGAAMRLVVQGDGNGDGRVDSADYLLIKRVVLGTFRPAPVYARAMCLTNGETVESADYLLLKRYMLGTYTLPTPLPPKNS